ncbi:MAG: N-acetylmuramoyl-L-alanine amidase, partial [Lachnospiraceae bacterium]|nr:N-acetylmuramoyl-L-alanine amidase [Lachnospiraceae bacterium]
TTNKKIYDMQKRCEIVENVKPDFMISIHQNSFSDGQVHGAQVFYYATSEESRALGEALQQALVTHVDPANHRKAKANESYYILKKTKCPSVIVECGFLSNEEECEKLKTDSYQKKLVEGIYQGILIYLQEKSGT